MVAEQDADPFADDNTVAFTGAYHPLGGDVFYHGTDGDNRLTLYPGSVHLAADEQMLVYHTGDVAGLRARAHDGDDVLDFTCNAGFGTADAISLLHGGAGENTAILQGTVGDDHATIHPSRATLEGPGYRVSVFNASEIIALGEGGTDVALLHGDPRPRTCWSAIPTRPPSPATGIPTRLPDSATCTFTARRETATKPCSKATPTDRTPSRPGPTRPSSPATTYLLRAKSFRDVRADGTPGGDDVALLHDDPVGIDTFVGGPDQAALSGDAFSLQANSFRYVHAYATAGGGDVATFHDDPARFDRLRVWPGEAKLFGEQFFLRAKSFGSVYANSTPGGGDQALLYDSLTDDTFTAWPDRAELSGDTFFVQVNSYRWVHSYSTEGNDVATLYGSGDRDVFVGTDRFGKLRGTDANREWILQSGRLFRATARLRRRRPRRGHAARRSSRRPASPSRST